MDNLDIVVSCLSGCFSKPQYVGVGFGSVPWNAPLASHVLIGHGLMLDPGSQQGLERRNRMLAPIMAKDEFIRKRLGLIAVRARFSETLGAATHIPLLGPC